MDVIVHLEVKQHVRDPTRDDINEFHSVNVRGTQSWLQWAADNNVRRVCLFSTIKAAGDSASIQDESGQLPPVTPYGQTKLAAEKAVRDWAFADPQRSALILRPAVVYGPGNQANMLTFIDAIHRNRYFLVGRNENVKSIISMRNLVAAVVHLLKKPSEKVELFYLVDKESYSVANLASMARKALGQTGAPRSLPLPLARILAFAGTVVTTAVRKEFPLTNNRLRALLETTHFSSAKLQASGFAHPQSTAEGLEEMVRWYLNRASRNSG